MGRAFSRRFLYCRSRAAQGRHRIRGGYDLCIRINEMMMIADIAGQRRRRCREDRKSTAKLALIVLRGAPVTSVVLSHPQTTHTQQSLEEKK
ncbi:hypothetical protein [Nevskia sp.]|uniref:hypothetical protein n=1 Tax=Nevskia sp. TaxID=1929292 RepID=UPI0025DC7F87|nr:hypothetical protein [Nevskia sp.]